IGAPFDVAVSIGQKGRNDGVTPILARPGRVERQEPVVAFIWGAPIHKRADHGGAGLLQRISEVPSDRKEDVVFVLGAATIVIESSVTGGTVYDLRIRV